MKTTYIINSWTDFLFNVFTYNLLVSDFILIMVLAFSAGCIGLICRAENLILVLIFGELMLVGVTFGFIVISKYFGDPSGQVFALFLLNSIAVESAVGLILILNTFRVCGTTELSPLQWMRG